MEILVEIPDDIAERLQAHRADLSRWILECLVAELYRSWGLTFAEVQRMLSFETECETDAFLKSKALRYGKLELR